MILRQRACGIRLPQCSYTTIVEPHRSKLINDYRNKVLGENDWVWRRGRNFDASKSRLATAFALRVDRDQRAPTFEVQGPGNLLASTLPGTAHDPSRKRSVQLKWSHDSLPHSLVQIVNQSLRFTTNEDQRTQLEKTLNALWQAFKEFEAERIRFSIHDWHEDLAFTIESMEVDENALRKHPQLLSMRAETLSVLEKQAEKDGLIYTQLDGSIGCIVNGAGLAMATNDILTHFGSKAANFLDTGGQATTDLLVKSFALLLSDERVTAILVNIFGGLIQCDMIAESVIRAANELDFKGVPVVVRLRGTNQEIGQEMIADSGLKLYPVLEIDEAAKKVISLSKTPKHQSKDSIPNGKRSFSTSRNLADDQRRQSLLRFNLESDTRVIYQGFTGKVATSNAKATIGYGTNVVGGVSPGKGGSNHLGLPVFDTVREAVSVVKADVTAIFVPALKAKAAIVEAIEAHVPLIVSVAEGVPLHDMLYIHELLRESGQSKLIGPNCPGIIHPRAQVRVGIMPYQQFSPGSVAIISKSGTLSYEAVSETTRYGLGQSIVLGVGGDMIPGTSMLEALKAILPRTDTQGIILIGEIGGHMEMEAAQWIKENNPERKPIVSMVAGHTAPDDRVMGHAGAIRRIGDLTAQHKCEALEDAGVSIVQHTAQLGSTMRSLLSQSSYQK